MRRGPRADQGSAEVVAFDARAPGVGRAPLVPACPKRLPAGWYLVTLPRRHTAGPGDPPGHRYRGLPGRLRDEDPRLGERPRHGRPGRRRRPWRPKAPISAAPAPTASLIAKTPAALHARRRRPCTDGVRAGGHGPLGRPRDLPARDGPSDRRGQGLRLRPVDAGSGVRYWSTSSTPTGRCTGARTRSTPGASFATATPARSRSPCTVRLLRIRGEGEDDVDGASALDRSTVHPNGDRRIRRVHRPRRCPGGELPARPEASRTTLDSRRPTSRSTGSSSPPTGWTSLTGRRVYVQGDRIRVTAHATFYEGTPVPGVPLRSDGFVERNRYHRRDAAPRHCRRPCSSRTTRTRASRTSDR